MVCDRLCDGTEPLTSILMVFEYSQIVDELTNGHPVGIGVGVLWQEAELLSYCRPLPRISRIETEDAHGPLSGFESGGQQTEEGGLACAVGSNDSRYACLQLEVDPLKCLGPPVTDVDIRHVNHRMWRIR